MGWFFIIFLFVLVIFIYVFITRSKYQEDLEAKGAISAASARFVKGIPDINQGTSVTLYLYNDRITINDQQVIPLPRIKRAIAFTEKEVTVKGKSVVGRAALGGILLGPLGALVGGLSGTKDKRQQKIIQFLSIEYIDRDQNENNLIFLNTLFSFNKFANSINREIGIIPTAPGQSYEI